MGPPETAQPEAKMVSQWSPRKKVLVALACAGAYLYVALLVSARVVAARLDDIAQAAAETELRLARLQAADQDLARDLELVETMFY